MAGQGRGGQGARPEQQPPPPPPPARSQEVEPVLPRDVVVRHERVGEGAQAGVVAGAVQGGLLLAHIGVKLVQEVGEAACITGAGSWGQFSTSFCARTCGEWSGECSEVF